MKSVIFILCTLIFGLPGMLSAELYKYYNQSGTLCFTDDVSMVPADQRPAVETIHEIQSDQIVPASSVTDAAIKPIPGQAVNPETGGTAELETEFIQLGQDEKNLNDEYLRLKARQALLILNGKRKMNTKEIIAYNQKVNELNEDTVNYKEKQHAYFKRVEAYNLKLKSAP